MKYIKLVVILALVALSGCANQAADHPSLDVPDWMDDGISTGEVSDVGLNSAPLSQAVADIDAGKFGEIHSMLVYKDGLLVMEEYFPGHKYQWVQPNYHGVYVNWDHYHRHNIMSAGKSFISALVAIAIDQGHINSVQDSIWAYLPNHQHLQTEEKNAITIEHLVTMTSGLEWDEWSAPYLTDANSIIDLWVNCTDQIACILSHDIVHQPASHFTYSGGDMILLGEIVQNATGEDIDDYLEQQLLEPLGIPRTVWLRFDNGIANTSGELHLTPREMLKFGILYLNDGEWEGEQLIPAEWVEKCKTPYTGKNSSWLNTAIWPIPGDDGTWGRRGYAYTWWTHRLSGSGHKVDIFYASGFGGQQIFVIPELDIVVVFTGGNYQQMLPNMKIIRRYILPAVE